MEVITRHSLRRAGDEAVRLWALASAQYPRQNDLIIEIVTEEIIETISAFALNARRALENLPPDKKFPLVQPRWKWAPASEGEVVSDLWDALNRVIHARRLEVGFEQLPENMSVVSGGAVVVPYVRARTDRKTLAFIDLFALSHAFLYGAFPTLKATGDSPRSNH